MLAAAVFRAQIRELGLQDGTRSFRVCVLAALVLEAAPSSAVWLPHSREHGEAGHVPTEGAGSVSPWKVTS